MAAVANTGNDENWTGHDLVHHLIYQLHPFKMGIINMLDHRLTAVQLMHIRHMMKEK